MKIGFSYYILFLVCVYWSIKTVYKSVKFTLFPQKRRTLDPVFSAHMTFIGYVQTPPRNKHSIPIDFINLYLVQIFCRWLF